MVYLATWVSLCRPVGRQDRNFVGRCDPEAQRSIHNLRNIASMQDYYTCITNIPLVVFRVSAKTRNFVSQRLCDNLAKYDLGI